MARIGGRGHSPGQASRFAQRISLNKPLFIGSPLEIPGAVVWLDASQSVFTTGSTPAVNNDPVSTWTDMADSNSVTQGTAAAKPTYKTGIINGRPIVRFDGTDDLMAKTTPTGFPSAAGMSQFIVGNTNKAATQVFASTRHSDAGNANKLYLTSDSTTTQFRTRCTDAGATTRSATRGDTTTDFVIFYSDVDITSGTETISINSGPRASTAAAYAQYAADTFRIGSGFNAIDFLAGDIAEVIVYSRPLSIVEKRLVEQYLSNKYGISLV